jgi:two-component system sensor histidine kinase and response regulator WspE
MGLTVDRFLGERELVVQPLDARLGKVPGISAAALLEDGAPVLIVDVDDLLCSVQDSLKSEVSGLKSDFRLQTSDLRLKRKRVLAVDDSLTVRELVRKLLGSRGYLVEVAVDGVEAWNLLVSSARGQVSGPDTSHLAPDTPHLIPFDLVITDVDMPRMDGIELARRIKAEAQFKSLPVMIVSYKDREEDRMRGLEAGADYYLSKGCFHDETLLQAVADLIGEAEGEG